MPTTTQADRIITPEPDKFHLKCQNIGIFDPYFFNPKDLDVVIDDNRLVYINVNDFKEYIMTLVKDKMIRMDRERFKIMFHI